MRFFYLGRKEESAGVGEPEHGHLGPFQIRDLSRGRAFPRALQTLFTQHPLMCVFLRQWVTRARSGYCVVGDVVPALRSPRSYGQTDR